MANPFIQIIQKFTEREMFPEELDIVEEVSISRKVVN